MNDMMGPGGGGGGGPGMGGFHGGPNNNNMGPMGGGGGGMGPNSMFGPNDMCGPGSNMMSGGPGVNGPKPMSIGAGKMYPPDQQKVFNPQNPSAPPIYPCGVCHKEVHDNDQGILCESGCNFFFHR